ncbi:MAG: cobalamin-dependent protein [Bacteriovoracaceae bacterium]|nr:cobalamin-dependent protein [Bacteriovoracaceae bacterium]
MSNQEIIKPYGDTLNDGIIQLSFTLPIDDGAKAKKAAEEYARLLNIDEPQISFSETIGKGFTYFVVYGKARPTLDYSTIVATEVKTENWDYYQINKKIKEELNRKVPVVGASIGSDAHTVGIDAIMNMKGYSGNYGLERYPEMEAFNMGAQVPCEELLKKALETNAEAILVSQTVTQKDAHIRNFTEFIELCEAEGVRDRFVLVAGGPRVTNDLAIELGFDAGFGPGSVPTDVATFIVMKLIDKKGA